MLRVFISSTFRDLEKERKALLEDLRSALVGVGMEEFIPDGKTSQEIGLGELRRSDVIIFLVSPYYGSLVKKCKVEDCTAECLVETAGAISYTHCEYKVALAENKCHQSYLVDRNWNVIEELKSWNRRTPDWRKVRESKVFDGLTNTEIEHYFEVAEKVWDFKEEVDGEFCPRIENVGAITHHLASNMISWYFDGKIGLDDFCGRKKELKELFEKMNDSVEVYGVGGIGKTTLVHVALLVHKLKGKKIATVGKRQSYLTGSGYKFFREKCKKEQHEIIGNNITLDDIIDALSIPDEIRLRSIQEKINVISDIIDKENMILFIDDFHLADTEVKELVKKAKGIVISSRKRMGISRNEVPLLGLGKNERDELADLITRRLGIKIGNYAKDKIKRITEGHPVSMEILLRNYQKIDFDRLMDYKSGLDFSKPEHAEEFLKRVVSEVLSEEAFGLLKNLSVMNTDLESNLDRDSIKKAYSTNGFDEVLAELIDVGMLKKKEEKEGIYDFSYSHIKETLEDVRARKEVHEKAIEYYRTKIGKRGINHEDSVEILFHRAKSCPDKNLIGDFLEIESQISPAHYCFRRLIDVGEELRKYSKGEFKAPLLGTIGNLYVDLGRFKDAERAFNEALEICRKLAKKNPEAYLPDVATTQNNLGILYRSLGRSEDAERAFNEALDIRKKITPKKSPS